MKVAAIVILTYLTLRQAVVTYRKNNSKEHDKLALILFPTVVIYLMSMGVI